MTEMDNNPQWREMDDETRGQAYSPSAALDGPLDPFIADYESKSRAAYAACPEVQCIPYEYRAANTIDFVVPRSETPVPCHIFIHGGYWQELSKRESFFPVIDTHQRGMAFAAVDYSLCPRAGIEDIVEECCNAVARIFFDAERLNIDPTRIVLSGSSAGAHLAAMVCTKLPAHLRPAGVVLMSGIYELEPLIGTYINDAVGMDLPTARRASPALANLVEFPPTVIAWGEFETDEFKRQSRFFAKLLKNAGRQVETLEMETRNHFDIVHDIANQSSLGHKMAALTNV